MLVAELGGVTAQSAGDSRGVNRTFARDRMIEEFTSLFRVRRVDAPDAALIAPQLPWADGLSVFERIRASAPA